MLLRALVLEWRTMSRLASVGSALGGARTYHYKMNDIAREKGMKGILAGESLNYENAKTDLEKVTVLRMTRRLPDGRPLEEVREAAFNGLLKQYNFLRTRVRYGRPLDGTRYFLKKLQGPRVTSWYPKNPRANPHNPFPMTPKQERWAARVETLKARGKAPPPRIRDFVQQLKEKIRERAASGLPAARKKKRKK